MSFRILSGGDLSGRGLRGAGRLTGAVLALALLSGCGLTEEWFGDPEPPPLPGQRISVIIESGAVEPDARLADLDVLLPPPYLNDAWPQSGGDAAHALHHLQVGDGLSRAWSRDFGAGSEGDQRRGRGDPLEAVGEGQIAGTGRQAHGQQRHEDAEATSGAEAEADEDAEQRGFQDRGFHGASSQDVGSYFYSTSDLAALFGRFLERLGGETWTRCRRPC